MGIESLVDPNSDVFYYLNHYLSAPPTSLNFGQEQTFRPRDGSLVKASQRMKAGDGLCFWPPWLGSGGARKQLSWKEGTLEFSHSFTWSICICLLCCILNPGGDRCLKPGPALLPVGVSPGLTISTSFISVLHHSKPMTFSVPISQMGKPNLRVETSSQNCDHVCHASWLSLSHTSPSCVLGEGRQCQQRQQGLKSRFHIVRLVGRSSS